MSFSTLQKEELLTHQLKSNCCKHAFIDGVLFTKGIIKDDFVTVSVDSLKNAEFISSVIFEILGKDTDIKSLAKGGRGVILSFSSKSFLKYIEDVSAGKCCLFRQKCSLCRQAFLRGIFFSSGRVSDPEKQYRLEFSPSVNMFELKGFLEECGLNFSVAIQRGKKILYSGNSYVIEDFFAEAGMNSTAFAFMNAKIKGDLKNSVNRIRNCETNNIEKSVSASIRQIEAIETLEKTNRLSTLPEELEKTARLRLKYRDYSLSRLAAEFSPPISKPGLSHRLNKIVEIADSIVAKGKEI